MKRLFLILYMLPIFSLANHIDGNWLNAKALSQNSDLFLGIFAYFGLVFREFSHSMSLTAIVSCLSSAFIPAIDLILSLRAKKQMIRSNALRIVAGVANLNTIFYRTIGNFPTNDMRATHLFANSDTPITVSAAIASNPKPAILSFVYELPEAFFNWSGFKASTELAVAFMAAIFSNGVTRRSEYAFAV